MTRDESISSKEAVYSRGSGFSCAAALCRLWKVTSVCALLSSAIINSAAFAEPVQPGTRAPQFSGVTFDNQQISLAAFQGKVVYLDFWASWCAPCKKTLPWMNELHDKFSSQGLVVLAVNEDSKNEPALELLSSISARFIPVRDGDGKIATLYSPPAMPSSYLIDRQGVVRAIFKGFNSGDEQRVEARIIELLAAESIEVRHD